MRIEQDDTDVEVTLRDLAAETASTEQFDPVVGADSLRSCVRGADFGSTGYELHPLDYISIATPLQGNPFRGGIVSVTTTVRSSTMYETTPMNPVIATMPRGGPDASWLDRRLQTDTLEYTDRYDIPDEIKQSVITALDRMGTRRGMHEQSARAALDLVTDVRNPRILELGAGHGKLSAKILELHPTATVTISDLDPTSVANIAIGDLGANPRADTRVIDATAIDADVDSYDLVVFNQAFHHLPPTTAARAIAEATRVGKQFLVIDLERPSPLRLLLLPLLVAPLALAATLVRPSLKPIVHDGFISMLRAYSRPAFIALGKAADPRMRIEFLPRRFRSGPRSATVVFSRHPSPA